MDKKLLEQLEGWEYKQLNGIDVLMSSELGNAGKIGIELIRNTKRDIHHINGFVMVGNERIYDKNQFSGGLTSALAIVEGYCFGDQVTKDSNEIIDEISDPSIEPIPPTQDNNIIVPGYKHDTEIIPTTKQFFPEVLTNEQLTQAHPGAIPVLVMLQNTDPLYIKERPGKGGKMVNYVEGNYMVRALNLAFMFDWSFEVEEAREEDKEVIVLGKLIVHMDSKTITKTQYGTHDIRFKKGSQEPISLANDYKGATTDSLKKCASWFGIAQDVYSQ